MTNKTVTEQHVVIWFRSDLRVVDNTALNHAIDSGLPIIALFIATPMQWHQHNMAAVQVDFIHRRLQVLKQQLAKRNIPLQVIEVNDFAESVHVIDQVCFDYNAVHVFANKQYPINEQQRDNFVGEFIAKKGIKFSIFDDNYILQPETVLTRDGELFKVFTPFRNAWIKRFTLSPSYPVTKKK
ncbi:hypothetical protein UB39_02505 [Photobacterium angustum]|nr:hypothetical protein UB39_02505 [Photobacterium angustum]